jgi:hypothetical protein
MWTQPLNIQTPLQIFGSSLLHWYNPSSIVTTDGKCSQWTDQGQHSTLYELTQATTNKRPTVVESGTSPLFGGDKHISWNNVVSGTDINLAHSSFTQTGAVTFFAVYKQLPNINAILIDNVANSANSIYIYVGLGLDAGLGRGVDPHGFLGKLNGTAYDYTFYLNRNTVLKKELFLMSQFGKYVASSSSRSFWGNNFVYVDGNTSVFQGNFITDQNRGSYDHIDSTAGLKLCGHQLGASIGSAGHLAEFGFINATTPQMTNAKLLQLKRYCLSRYNMSI